MQCLKEDSMQPFLLWHLFRREHYHSKATTVSLEEVGGSRDRIQEFQKCNLVTFHKVHKPGQWDGINIGRPLILETKTMLRNNKENRCKTGRGVWIQIESLVPYTHQVAHSCSEDLPMIFVKISSDEKKGFWVCFRCCRLGHLRTECKISLKCSECNSTSNMTAMHMFKPPSGTTSDTEEGRESWWQGESWCHSI